MNNPPTNPANFVQGLFNGIDREIQTGIHEVQAWIDAQIHGAAVQLLNTLLPPIVHTGNTTVKVSETIIVGPASTTIGFTLGTADTSNEFLAGAVANTVRRGLNELKHEGNYGRGTDSIAW